MADSFWLKGVYEMAWMIGIMLVVFFLEARGRFRFIPMKRPAGFCREVGLSSYKKLIVWRQGFLTELYRKLYRNNFSVRPLIFFRITGLPIRIYLIN
jgi:hypothetical protein